MFNSAFKTANLTAASKVLKISGGFFAGAGVLVSSYQYGSNQISGFEFTVDVGMTAVGVFGGPIGAGVSLVYFGGKAIYEYNSGKTLFIKP